MESIDGNTSNVVDYHYPVFLGILSHSTKFHSCTYKNLYVIYLQVSKIVINVCNAKSLVNFYFHYLLITFIYCINIAWKKNLLCRNGCKISVAASRTIM